MNRRSTGNAALLSQISRDRSKNKRSAALSAAAKGSTAREIVQNAQVSLKIAGEALTKYRLMTLPHLIDHQATVKGVIFEDLIRLSERFSLSDARLRVLAQRHNLNKVWAISPHTKRVNVCYRPEDFESKLTSWSKRHSYFLKYRQLLSGLKAERYPELSEPLMATLLGLILLLKETSGAPPSYEEIEQSGSLPAKRARRYIPELERLGFITRIPVYNPRRGHPSFRYLVHRAPAKLVTHPFRCPDCGSSSWIPYPWYQAKRFGNGVGK